MLFFFCVCVFLFVLFSFFLWSLPSWIWHYTKRHWFWITEELDHIQSGSSSPGENIRKWSGYAVHVGFYLAGDSRLSSFLPLERSPFFFLLAKSWALPVSRGRLGILLVGLSGLMVPGSSGRTIGDGARTGVTSLSTRVSGVIWGERWWGRKQGSVGRWNVVSLGKQVDTYRSWSF